MQQKVNVRRIALDLLNKCESEKSFSNIVIDTAIRRNGLTGSDRALLTALFYGVIEKKLTLDHIIDQLSSIPKSKIEKDTKNLLRLGIYQLGFMDKIPPHAAVNETVSLAKARSRSFVNALLRRFTREKENISLPSPNGDTLKYLSVRYSVGEALCARLLDAYGREECESLLAALSAAPPITLRANTLKITRDDLISSLLSQFPSARPTENAPHGVIIDEGAISELSPLSLGLCTVQDEASQLCVAALGAKAGELIVDVCACPGSKSFGAAIDMENKGSLLSFDIHENKLSLVRDGAERLGITVISTEAHDAREPIDSLLERADRVICDVPCSGFGVIAKKPELRYKDPSESERLPDIQLSILQSASKYLKRGGVLVYSTCTLLPEENGAVVERFLSENPDFSLVPFSIGAIDAPCGSITLMPHKHGTDGFFIAKLTRNN